MFNIPFQVEKSITIKKSPSQIFDVVADFETWPRWSPWLFQEPECKVVVKGTKGSAGHSQEWEGDVIGAGNIELIKVRANQSLEYKLNFLKPWKSRSLFGFRLKSSGKETELRWWMKGTVPFFMFFIKKMMISMIGDDYRRGLMMLKEDLETGEVLTETTTKGVVDRPEIFYIGKRDSGSMEELGPKMTDAFTALEKLSRNGDLGTPAAVAAIYNDSDKVNDRFDFTTAFFYDAKPAERDGFEVGSIPEHRAFQAEHRGSYRHLGNGWAASMGCARAKHKINKALPAYEVYANNPGEVKEKDLLTEIYVPVKN